MSALTQLASGPVDGSVGIIVKCFNKALTGRREVLQIGWVDHDTFPDKDDIAKVVLFLGIRERWDATCMKGSIVPC